MGTSTSVLVLGDTAQRRLLQLGALLFLLGLVSGFIIPLMTNPRMGLSAHLEGVMNGTFLLAVGAIWGLVNLQTGGLKITFWMLAIGTATNWLFVQLAALWGTNAMAPQASAGFQGTPWQEMAVTVGLGITGVTMVLGSLLLLMGLLRRS